MNQKNGCVTLKLDSRLIDTVKNPIAISDYLELKLNEDKTQTLETKICKKIELYGFLTDEGFNPDPDIYFSFQGNFNSENKDLHFNLKNRKNTKFCDFNCEEKEKTVYFNDGSTYNNLQNTTIVLKKNENVQIVVNNNFFIMLLNIYYE